ncbi:uncharacterized protein LOC120128977 [Hibiscus syriacus]|uniref:uncharacterized protein LOC120128977 n=1 Tax=Hibiscus syriacus TaxID=106335 RepID=UPI001922DEF9|nr:uncharacterized protein LOC120128977 [Hibiscus syriacus]
MCRLILKVQSWFVVGMMISRLCLRPLLNLVGMSGILEPWLQSKGLNDANQGLAYFTVSKLGEPPTDGKTDTNPKGLTAAYGKCASSIATRLHAGGLSCKLCLLKMGSSFFVQNGPVELLAQSMLVQDYVFF